MDFASLWEMARRPVPLAIVGGGRWGRTWASVAADARGSSEGLILVANTDAASAQAWAAKAQPDLPVASSLSNALHLLPSLRAAIIASRPAHHVRDGLEAIENGLDVLVEKPLSHRADLGRLLLNETEKRQRILALGAEFAFHPTLHQCAHLVPPEAAKVSSMRLHWHDPENETRHGGLKAYHEETGPLVDLLPHAFSIFRIFIPHAALRVVRASEDVESGTSVLELSDAHGARCELHCTRRSHARQRILDVFYGGNVHTKVDFSSNTPTVWSQNEVVAVDVNLSAFPSTLRLELGAFLSETCDPKRVTSMRPDLSALIDLQANLDAALARQSSVA